MILRDEILLDQRNDKIESEPPQQAVHSGFCTALAAGGSRHPKTSLDTAHQHCRCIRQSQSLPLLLFLALSCFPEENKIGVSFLMWGFPHWH